MKVYPDPDPGVIEFLREFTDLHAAWPELPEALSEK